MIDSLFGDPVLAATVIGLGLTCLMMTVLAPHLGIGLILLIFLSSATLWGGAFGRGADLRPLSIPLVAVLLLTALARRDVRPVRDKRAAFLMAVLAFAIFNALSISWSTLPSETAGAALAWVQLSVLAFWVASTRKNSMSTRRNLTILLWSFLILSTFSLVMGYPEPWSGARAQGIANNPNGLAILAMILTPLALAAPSKARKLAVALPLVLCILTGSRAAVIGLLIGGSLFVWRSTSVRGKLLLAPLLVVPLYLGAELVGSVVQGEVYDSPLLRSNHSREDVWALALTTFEQNPWLGVGAGALTTESGSSYLKVLSELGLFGGALGCILLVTALRASWQSKAVSAIVVASLFEAAFEGWLFTAGSVYTVLLITLVSSVTPSNQLDSEQHVATSAARLRHAPRRGIATERQAQRIPYQR